MTTVKIWATATTQSTTSPHPMPMLSQYYDGWGMDLRTNVIEYFYYDVPLNQARQAKRNLPRGYSMTITSVK